MHAQSAGKAGRPVGKRDTPERCLLAAEQLFADSGFAGTSLRTICAQAGVSIATLLHHFDSKERLYSRVLGRVAQSMQEYSPEIQVAVVDADAGADMVDRHLDWTIAHPHYSRLIMRELMENPARAAEARHWHMRPVTSIWIDLIRRGQHAGALGKFDAEMFVFSFTGAIAHFYSAPTAAAAILSIAGSAEVVGRYRSWLGDGTLAMLRSYSH